MLAICHSWHGLALGVAGLLALALLPSSGSGDGGPTSASGPCRAAVRGSRVELRAPAFTLVLDMGRGLRAVALDNHLTGHSLKLDGPEVEADLSAWEARVELGPWRWASGEPDPSRPDSDPGYREGRWRAAFGDSGWSSVMVPPSAGWARTRFPLPADARDKPVFITLGGFGLFDFRFMRVFVNGREIATRRWEGRWGEPGVFELRPGTREHDSLVAGDAGQNVLALQLGGYVDRTAALDAVDPTRAWTYPKHGWPPQFEQYATVGRPFTTPELAVGGVDVTEQGESGVVEFELRSRDGGLGATARYEWRADAPTLRKIVRVRNLGASAVRLMNVRLGDYALDADATDGERGFPVYVGGKAFLTLAHPSGWAVGRGRGVVLRQYPGRLLAPGEEFAAMDTVLGVAERGRAREAFLAHLRPLMRRVLRGHDRPYATIESFGGQPDGSFFTRSDYIREHLAKVADAQRETGCRFDRYGIEFWADYRGDLTGCDPVRFPEGLAPIRRELGNLGMSLSLWIDNTREDWSIGGNPALAGCYSGTPGFFCRACEPINRLYTEGLLYQIREYGVTQLKLDGQRAICYNARHEHLPGVYSTEAISDALIEHLRTLDAAAPEVFLMLYWGCRSPWWLLWGDTLFEPGLGIEAASPGPTPRLHVRDGVTVGLDQAQRWCADVPPLGKDSLGVWLSDWPWNSSIGKERWQAGLVMDLCRGSLLAQPWTDTDWLTPPERREMADFVALLRERPGCFGNPRPILGDPWKAEPYGYCCSDGERAFLAINNCTWSDLSVPLELSPTWGLPAGRAWDLYRWYPDPVRLKGRRGAPGRVLLRPFEVWLLEVVPAGGTPSLGRAFPEVTAPSRFDEPSAPIALHIGADTAAADDGPRTMWVPARVVSASSASGVRLQALPDGSVLSAGPVPDYGTYTVTLETKLTSLTGIRLEALPRESLPGGGPGWAVNGNYQLSEIGVEATPIVGGGASQPVRLASAAADFEQTSYGGWPAAAALDGHPSTAWSVDPEEGWPHAAAFGFAEPVASPGGARLTVTLTNGNRGHSLGRFRLSVTGDAGQLGPGLGLGRPLPVLTGRVPPTRGGGTLVVTAEMTRDGRAFLVGDVEQRFAIAATVDGTEAPAERVVPSPSYPVSWQAWRIPLGAAGTAREFRIAFRAVQVPPGVALAYSAYFVPAGR
jgi:hypothetical protein